MDLRPTDAEAGAQEASALMAQFHSEYALLHQDKRHESELRLGNDGLPLRPWCMAEQKAHEPGPGGIGVPPCPVITFEQYVERRAAELSVLHHAPEPEAPSLTPSQLAEQKERLATEAAGHELAAANLVAQQEHIAAMKAALDEAAHNPLSPQ